MESEIQKTINIAAPAVTTSNKNTGGTGTCSKTGTYSKTGRHLFYSAMPKTGVVHIFAFTLLVPNIAFSPSPNPIQIFLGGRTGSKKFWKKIPKMLLIVAPTGRHLFLTITPKTGATPIFGLGSLYSIQISIPPLLSTTGARWPLHLLFVIDPLLWRRGQACLPCSIQLDMCCFLASIFACLIAFVLSSSCR